MGRPWPQPGEPLFLEEDTLAVLEWQKEKAAQCPGCGLPRDETMSKEAQDGIYESKPFRCHACAARDRARDEYTKGEHDDAGLMFSIEKVGEE